MVSYWEHWEDLSLQVAKDLLSGVLGSTAGQGLPLKEPPFVLLPGG